MEDVKRLEEILTHHATEITADLSGRKTYNVDEVRAMITTRLYSAMYDFSKTNHLALCQKRASMVEEYGRLHRMSDKSKAIQHGTKIAKVNEAKKKANYLYQTLKNYNEFQQLRHYILDKFGEEVMTDFTVNYLDKPENKTHILLK